MIISDISSKEIKNLFSISNSNSLLEFRNKKVKIKAHRP
jgi:hypothetical protein